jgi:hypothetical protein
MVRAGVQGQKVTELTVLISVGLVVAAGTAERGSSIPWTDHHESLAAAAAAAVRQTLAAAKSSINPAWFWATPPGAR